MEGRKLSILQSIFGSFKRENKGQFLFYCPECNHHKPKLAVNLEKGCKCWICNIRFKTAFDLVKKYGNFEQIREWKEIDGITDFSELEYFFHIQNEVPKKKEKLKLPEEFKTLVSNKLSVEGKIARNYLLGRGITDEDICYYRIGYSTEGDLRNRVIVPSFSDNGEINYYIARSYDDDRIKYLYPKVNHKEIIVNELYVNWEEPVILVEGIMDAIKGGFQAIPILGSVLKEESRLFQSIVKHNAKVFIALDRDAKNKEIKIIENLLDYNVEVRKVAIPEEFKDVGEMTKEHFNYVKENNSFLLTRQTVLCYKFR